MLTFNLPVVNRNCFLITIIIWCMGYYLLAWVLFAMVAAVEYDEVKSLYSSYEEYYADRMEQERGTTTEDVSADAHILEEQITLYTQENYSQGDITPQGNNTAQNDYNYHETENADLDNDSSGPRTQYTETEAFWTEMIYKDWYHPTGIVMPEAIHYDIHSVCMYQSYYTYKKWQVDEEVITTTVGTPQVKVLPATGLFMNHTTVMQQCYLHAYAYGYTHEVAYKKMGIPSGYNTHEYKYARI